MLRVVRQACNSRWVRRFSLNCDGVAAIEFAMVAPIVLVLFLGTLEISQALMADRRVTQIASSSADLVAQTDALDTTEMDGIMLIVDQIIRPYDPAFMKITVLNVAANPNNADDVRVCWAYHHNGGTNTTVTAGSPYTLPSGFLEPGDSVVIAEVEYDYQPLVVSDLFVSTLLKLEESFFLKPRRSTAVELDGQVCTFS
ncbi:MAG: TadE/TadG family type IV pilus assembly protein [Pseudomonadota bacterium]